MTKIIYTRISPQDKEDRISPEMQANKCIEMCKGEDYKVFHETFISGDTDLEKCPALKKALDSLKKGDTFMIWKMDRLSRDIMKMGHILKIIDKKKASIYSVVEPNFFENNLEASLMRNVTMVIAEHELKSIRLRVKTALQEKRKRGQRVGHIPYGYQLGEGKMLIPNEREQAILRQMEFMYQSESMTYREVAESLNNMAVRNRAGCEWSHSSVYRILKNRLRHAEVYIREFSALH